MTGPAGIAADLEQVADEAGQTLLIATLGLVLVLLLVVYRAPLLALLPLLAVGAAYLVAIGIAYLLIEAGWITVNTEGTFLLLVLVFGAGTDYSLLLVHRYREELRRGRARRREALPPALRESVPAIAASGGTVIAAMLVLLVADLRVDPLARPDPGDRDRGDARRRLHPAAGAALAARRARLLAGARDRAVPRSGAAVGKGTADAGSGSPAWSGAARGRSSSLVSAAPGRARARQPRPPRHDRVRPGRDRADQLQPRHQGARTNTSRPGSARR